MASFARGFAQTFGPGVAIGARSAIERRRAAAEEKRFGELMAFRQEQAKATAAFRQQQSKLQERNLELRDRQLGLQEAESLAKLLDMPIARRKGLSRLRQKEGSLPPLWADAIGTFADEDAKELASAVRAFSAFNPNFTKSQLEEVLRNTPPSQWAQQGFKLAGELRQQRSLEIQEETLGLRRDESKFRQGMAEREQDLAEERFDEATSRFERTFQRSGSQFERQQSLREEEAERRAIEAEREFGLDVEKTRQKERLEKSKAGRAERTAAEKASRKKLSQEVTDILAEDDILPSEATGAQVAAARKQAVKERLERAVKQGTGIEEAKSLRGLAKQRTRVRRVIDGINRVQDAVIARPAIVGTPGAISRAITSVSGQLKAFVDLVLPVADLKFLGDINRTEYTGIFRETGIESAKQQSAILGLSIALAAAEGFENRAVTDRKIQLNMRRLGDALGGGDAETVVNVLEQLKSEVAETFEVARQGIQEPSVLSTPVLREGDARSFRKIPLPPARFTRERR